MKLIKYATIAVVPILFAAGCETTATTQKTAPTTPTTSTHSSTAPAAGSQTAETTRNTTNHTTAQPAAEAHSTPKTSPTHGPTEPTTEPDNPDKGKGKRRKGQAKQTLRVPIFSLGVSERHDGSCHPSIAYFRADLSSQCNLFALQASGRKAVSPNQPFATSLKLLRG